MNSVLLIHQSNDEWLSNILCILKELPNLDLYVYVINDSSDDCLKKQNCIEATLGSSCKISFLFSDIYFSQSRETIRALNWFFKEVSEGIIIEEGYYPSTQFFNFLTWSLEKFRNHPEVSHINSSNFGVPSKYFKSEVNYINIPCFGGWATWAKEWNSCSFNPFYINEELSFLKWRLPLLARFIVHSYLLGWKRRLDDWEWLWMINILNRSKLCITPRDNYLSQIPVTEHELEQYQPLGSQKYLTANFYPEKNQNLQIDENLLKRVLLKKNLLSYSKGIKYILNYIKYHTFNPLKELARNILFYDINPIVVASTGRAGSTVINAALREGFAAHYCKRYPFVPEDVIYKLCYGLIDRLWDMKYVQNRPILKTHDLFSLDVNYKATFIFIYGDPLDSALSVVRQGQKYGQGWIDQHLYHLRCSNQPFEIFKNDILNFEKQIKSWDQPHVLKIYYKDIWNRKSEIEDFVGFALKLPPYREREVKVMPSNINTKLFARLRCSVNNLRKNSN